MLNRGSSNPNTTKTLSSITLRKVTTCTRERLNFFTRRCRLNATETRFTSLYISDSVPLLRRAVMKRAIPATSDPAPINPGHELVKCCVFFYRSRFCLHGTNFFRRGHVVYELKHKQNKSEDDQADAIDSTELHFSGLHWLDRKCIAKDGGRKSRDV